MPRQNIPSYIVEIPADGPNEKLAGAAFADALQRCSSNNPKSLMIVVPQKSNIPEWIETFIGASAVKALKKDGSISFEGVSLHLEGVRTFNPHVKYGVVFGVNLDKKDLNKLDDTLEANAIYFVQWSVADGQYWARSWQPAIVGTSNWKLIYPTLPGVVEEELRKLPANNLRHPNDLKTVRASLKALKAKSQNVDPMLVRKWALQRGWRPSDADDLMREAAK